MELNLGLRSGTDSPDSFWGCVVKSGGEARIYSRMVSAGEKPSEISEGGSE
ncbi:hypothetical protein D3C76_1679730 [compost metagenome]